MYLLIRHKANQLNQSQRIKIMNTFTVTVTETLERQVEVTAENAQAAYDQVSSSYKNQDLVLDSDDFSHYSIAILSDQD